MVLLGSLDVQEEGGPSDNEKSCQVGWLPRKRPQVKEKNYSSKKRQKLFRKKKSLNGVVRMHKRKREKEECESRLPKSGWNVGRSTNS